MDAIVIHGVDINTCNAVRIEQILSLYTKVKNLKLPLYWSFVVLYYLVFINLISLIFEAKFLTKFTASTVILFAHFPKKLAQIITCLFFQICTWWLLLATSDANLLLCPAVQYTPIRCTCFFSFMEKFMRTHKMSNWGQSLLLLSTL